MYCNYCDAEFIVAPLSRSVYETPWETEPTEKVFCDENCEEDYLYGGDYSYFTCESCEREICSQNPENGWHIQYRDRGDGTVLCLQCYKKEIKANGVSLETLRQGIIPGMFLNTEELIDEGWEEVSIEYVSEEQNVKNILQKVLTLDKEGYICIIDYERLSICGSEGTITLYKRRK